MRAAVFLLLGATGASGTATRYVSLKGRWNPTLAKAGRTNPTISKAGRTNPTISKRGRWQ